MWASEGINEYLNILSSRDLVLATRWWSGAKGNYSDLTFLITLLIWNLSWRVNEHYTDFEPQPIICTINKEISNFPENIDTKFIGWSSGKLDKVVVFRHHSGPFIS